MEGNGQTFGQSRAAQRWQELPVDEQVQQLQAKWDICQKQVELLLQQVDSSGIDQQELYPTIPYTIVNTVCGMFGFTPRGGLVETELLSTHEAVIGGAISSAQFAGSR